MRWDGAEFSGSCAQRRLGPGVIGEGRAVPERECRADQAVARPTWVRCTNHCWDCGFRLAGARGRRRESVREPAEPVGSLAGWAQLAAAQVVREARGPI